MAAEGTFDGVLLGIAQQHAGIDALLDTMFSFLRRKTDFFTGAASGKARDAVLSAFDRQRRLADEQKSGSGDNEKAAAEASRQIAARKAAAAALTPEELLAKEAADLEKKAVPKVAAETATSISATTSATTTTAAASGDEKKSDAMATDDDDKPDDPAKGAQPNIGNGSTGPGYVWTQVLSDVEVRVPLKAGLRSKDLDVVIKKNHLRVGVKGQPAVLDGALEHEVKVDECVWTLEDKSLLVLTLVKQNQMEWWKCVIKGHPIINVQKVQPENSKLSDLDGETRSTVEKMMFDQRQKELGLPSSDDMKKQEMLKKFMDSHPEMDFSKAKFN